MSVDAAKSLLQSSGVSAKGRVRDAMQRSKWTASNSQLMSVGAHYDEGASDVLIFPSAATSPTGADDILKAFGAMVFASLSKKEKEEWERKLAIVLPRQVIAVQERLKQHDTYMAAVESFGSAVDRLVALHFANAFIANRVPVVQARGYALNEFGGTSQLANTQSMYSLVPLTSAYCPHLSDFPAAFAARVKGLQDHVFESSVRDALCLLIDRLIA